MASTESSSQPVRERKLVDYTQRGKRLSVRKGRATRASNTYITSLNDEGERHVTGSGSRSVSSYSSSIPDSKDILSGQTSVITEDEPIEFFLMIPSRENRAKTSDLRERFHPTQQRSKSPKKKSLIQTVLTLSSLPYHRPTSTEKLREACKNLKANQKSRRSCFFSKDK